MSAEIEQQSRRRRRPTPQEEIDETDAQGVEESTETRGITAKKGYATPGRRNKAATEEAETSIIPRPLQRLRNYYQGVTDELQKVTWPTREESIRLTRIVLVVTILASLVLGAISTGFSFLFVRGIDNPIYFVIFFAAVALVYYFGVRRFFQNPE